MKKVTFDNQKYIAPSWKEMGELCFELSKKVLAKKRKFDRIVALAKGGFTWSRALADYLAIEDISAIHVRFYHDVYDTDKKPVIVQSLSVSVEGETVLVLDDVADSGETLALTCEYLKLCGVKQVETATLFHKPWSKFTPTYYAATSDAWIVFPHEMREIIHLLCTKWKKQGIKHKEMRIRLIMLGLPIEQIDFFYP